MAQTVLTVAGYAIGSYFGYPQLGALVGAAVGAYVAAPDITGPKLDDLKVAVSSFGVAEPIGYGDFPVTGNCTFGQDLEPTEHEEGKGGSSTTTSYAVTFMANLCAGRRDNGPRALRKLWLDAKLVYDASETATPEALAASAEFAQYFVFYQGTETQLPDPTMEGLLGVGNVPAYRGSTYIMFVHLPAAPYGNRPPSVMAEIVDGEGDPVGTPPDAVTDLVAADGAGPSHGTVGLTWSAAAGSDTYTVRRQRNGAPWTIVASGIVTPGSGDNLAATFATDLGVIYSYQVISINADGETYGNIVSIQYVGTIGGSGTYRSDEWVSGCNDYWNDPATGTYGTGNPGAKTFGNFCYKYNAGGYAGDLVGTDFALEVVGEVPVPDASATVGIVNAGSALLSDIVLDIADRVGSDPDIHDVTGIDEIVVPGYVITRQMPGRAAIEPLWQYGDVDACEIDDGIKWIVRGGAAVVSIGIDDLGAGEEDPADVAIIPNRAQETDLPRSVAVAYMATSRAFETGTQIARRMSTGSQQDVSLALAIAMDDQKGAEIASRSLYRAWTERNSVEWRVLRSLSAQTPGDIWTINDGEFIRRVRGIDKSEQGPIVVWKGVADSAADHSPNAVAAVGTGRTTINVPASTIPMTLVLMDIPPVRDEDAILGAGYYVAGSTEGRYYRSLDGGSSYAPVDDTVVAAIGSAQTILSDFDGGNCGDERSSVAVQFASGTLPSTLSRSAWRSGGNLILVGSELVNVRDVAIVSADTVTFTGLLRGRFGTEQHKGTHALFEQVVVLTPSTVLREAEGLSNVNILTKAKGVTFGRSLAATTAQDFTDTGASVKPLSVVHLAAIDAGGGDYLVRWKARARYGLAWRPFVDVPTAALPIGYSVEVESSGVIGTPQTIAATDRSATVTASSGDIVRVYPLSDLIGRGFPAEVEIA